MRKLGKFLVFEKDLLLFRAISSQLWGRLAVLRDYIFFVPISALRRNWKISPCMVEGGCLPDGRGLFSPAPHLAPALCQRLFTKLLPRGFSKPPYNLTNIGYSCMVCRGLSWDLKLWLFKTSSQQSNKVLLSCNVQSHIVWWAWR